MYRTGVRHILIVVFFLYTSLLYAGDNVSRTYSLPNHGVLRLTMPETWASKVSRAQKNYPPTIVLSPGDTASFQLLITPIWSMRAGMKLPGPAEIRDTVAAAARKIGRQTGEGNIPIRELQGDAVSGYYFSAADKETKPGEYKFMTQGMVRLGELLITFTALSNDRHQDAAHKAIAILKSASYRQTRANVAGGGHNAGVDVIQVMQQEKFYLLTVPASRLVLQLPREGFLQKRNSYGGGANSPRYFYFADEGRNLIISGWFEPEQGYGGVKKLWADVTRAWKKNKLPEPRNVVFKKTGNWDVIIYDSDVAVGVNSHIRASWVQAGTWIDMHLSITSGDSGVDTRGRLESLLRSITVMEKK